MAHSTITLIILEGTPLGTGAIEAKVRAIRHAAILDNCRKFRQCSLLGDIIVATNDDDLPLILSHCPCRIHRFQSGEHFHFGRLLTDLVHEYRCEKVFYLGGGAGLFLTSREIEEICRELSEKEGIFFTNNFFSSDFVAFSPGSIVDSFELPKIDNLLAYLLKEEGGLELRRIPPSWGTMFDIDTPADIMVLSLLPGVPPATAEALQSLHFDRSRLEKLIGLFTDGSKELMIYGRLNPRVAVHMEESLRCRLRIFSEERGMKARGRVERGEVGSIISSLMGRVGLQDFFHIVETFCHGAVLDSRLICAHYKRDASRKDRFLSDIGDYNAIDDDFVRELTRLSTGAAVPVVLGGHSLLSGGLWVLSEACRIIQGRDYSDAGHM